MRSSSLTRPDFSVKAISTPASLRSDGVAGITGIDIKELNNWSDKRKQKDGKRYRVPFTAEFLESQIDTLYCAQLGNDSRLLAEEYLDVDKAIDRILRLADGQQMKVTNEKPI